MSIFDGMVVVAGHAGVASPNLSGLRDAIKSLAPEQQAEYYARFLDEPRWVGPLSRQAYGAGACQGEEGETQS